MDGALTRMPTPPPFPLPFAYGPLSGQTKEKKRRRRLTAVFSTMLLPLCCSVFAAPTAASHSLRSAAVGSVFAHRMSALIEQKWYNPSPRAGARRGDTRVTTTTVVRRRSTIEVQSNISEAPASLQGIVRKIQPGQNTGIRLTDAWDVSGVHLQSLNAVISTNRGTV